LPGSDNRETSRARNRFGSNAISREIVGGDYCDLSDSNNVAEPGSKSLKRQCNEERCENKKSEAKGSGMKYVLDVACEDGGTVGLACDIYRIPFCINIYLFTRSYRWK